MALFMEMRLGKTLVAIRWAEQWTGPKLVVAPLSVLQVWREELLTESLPSAILDLHYDPTRASGGDDGDAHDDLAVTYGPVEWFVCNKESLFRDRGPTWIAKYPWTVVILDESVCIKNPRAVTTKICNRYLAAHAEHRAALSGLPNPQSSLDFFEQMRFVYGSFMGHTNAWAFRNEFFRPTPWGAWRARVGADDRIRAAVRCNAVCMSRQEWKADNVRVVEPRYVSLPENVRRAYKEVRTAFAFKDQTTKYHIVRFQWLRRLATGQPSAPLPYHTRKCKELLEILEQVDGQVVVWYVHTAEALAIEGVLSDNHVGLVCINGMSSRKRRDVVTRRFRDGKCRVMLAQVQTAKHGLNFSHCDTAIYYSLPLGTDDWAQSLDRISLPEKKTPNLVIPILAEKTVDVRIFKLLQRKHSQGRSVLFDAIREEREEVRRGVR